MTDKHITELQDANGHLDAALEHHEAGNFGAAKRRTALARGCIERALQAMGYQDPTAETGAQASNGQQPRAYDAESIRLRDQRAGIEAAYRFRQSLGRAR